ncbi:hypothetical protein ACFL17_07205 [Pseudomonadota bacterium]
MTKKKNKERVYTDAQYVLMVEEDHWIVEQLEEHGSAWQFALNLIDEAQDSFNAFGEKEYNFLINFIMGDDFYPKPPTDYQVLNKRKIFEAKIYYVYQKKKGVSDEEIIGELANQFDAGESTVRDWLGKGK